VVAGSSNQTEAFMPIDSEFKRFKQVREELNLTQVAFAEVLGIGTTTVDIERGRTRIPGVAVKELLKRYQINPLWLFGESGQKYLPTEAVLPAPKIVTVDGDGGENIVLVGAKAAAGYPFNIGDQQWFGGLPAFSIPLPQYRNASFRGFQVDGDSMFPALNSGEWIMSKAVDHWDSVNDTHMYVVVTNESVLVKKIRKHAKNELLVELLSINPAYQPILLDRGEINELWQVNSKLSFDLDVNTEPSTLQGMHQELRALKEEVRGLLTSIETRK
jgi:DNA-binding XRE family transcriptional regulator